MKKTHISAQTSDHICTLTIDHPPANAWSLRTMEEFELALRKAEDDRNVRVVLITGSGDKFFSAGFDVRDAANAEGASRKGQELWKRVDCFPKPVIAAINGVALGGGCELALACHFRLMSSDPKVKMGLTEVNLGIIPGWGGTQRMTRLVGRAKALDLILFGRKIDAVEALETGLVDKVSSPGQVVADAVELGRRLAARPPIAVSCVLKAITAGIYQGIDQGLKVEQESSQLLGQTKDAREGVLAFLEKRPPKFTGE